MDSSPIFRVYCQAPFGYLVHALSQSVRHAVRVVFIQSANRRRVFTVLLFWHFSFLLLLYGFSSPTAWTAGACSEGAVCHGVHVVSCWSADSRRVSTSVFLFRCGGVSTVECRNTICYITVESFRLVWIHLRSFACISRRRLGIWCKR